jgi:hypothetical protein
VGWDEMGWDGMGWDEMGWDGIGSDRIGSDRMRWDESAGRWQKRSSFRFTFAPLPSLRVTTEGSPPAVHHKVPRRQWALGSGQWAVTSQWALIAMAAWAECEPFSSPKRARGSVRGGEGVCIVCAV